MTVSVCTYIKKRVVKNLKLKCGPYIKAPAGQNNLEKGEVGVGIVH